MEEKDFNPMLELRLEHAATPERVAAATRLLADLLAPLIPIDKPSDESEHVQPAITIVVNNLATSATVRVWRPEYVPKVEFLTEVIADPSAIEVVAPEFVAPLTALAKYARAEADFHPSFWEGAKRLRSVNENFAEEIEKLVRTKRKIPPRVLGAKYITTQIHEVSVVRRTGGLSPRFMARIELVPGTMVRVEVDPSVAAQFTVAYEAGRETGQYFRVKLVGNWLRRGEVLEFAEDPKTLKATAIDDRVATGDGVALLRHLQEAPILKRAEAASILRKLAEDEDD